MLKIKSFISKGAGIFAGLMKQDLKSPDHFLYGYIADGYQLALYTGYEERKVSVNYKLRPGIYIVSRANACQYDMTKFQAVEFIGGRTGVHSSLPADLRVHFKPWYPGTACFCLNGAEDKMVKEPLRFENGCMLIPEAPGIGVELADDAEDLYPANERGSNAARRAFDGSVKDW